jgi:hypothetical protein
VGKTLKVTLGRVAYSGVESYFGSDVPTAVRTAVLDYARRLRLGPPPVAMPRLLRDASRSAPTASVELAVDAETMATLEAEAARQHSTVEKLAAHSVLAYLAEIDQMTPLGAIAA